MKLTPIDIKKQEFKKQLNGYDRDEVESFLEHVADRYEALLNQIQELRKKNEFQEAKLREFRQKEETLQDAMASAQKVSRVQEEESSRQSEIIVQDASLEAERIIVAARKQREEILSDVAKLEGQRHSYILKVEQILKGQLDLIEILESEDVSSLSLPGLKADIQILNKERLNFLAKMKRIHQGQLGLIEVLGGISPEKGV